MTENCQVNDCQKRPLIAALEAIQQRANESGTGEMALIDTIHAMHKIARDAVAACPHRKSRHEQKIRRMDSPA